MHYGAYAFAKNRYRPTIIAKKGNGELGQRKGFSPVISPFISVISYLFVDVSDLHKVINLKRKKNVTVFF